MRPFAAALCAATIFSAAAAPARADGELDVSYGTEGVSIAPVGTAMAPAAAVVRSPGGNKVIVVGDVEGGDVAIARFRPGGNLDPGFGDDGIVILDLGGTEEAAGVAVDSQDRVVVATTRTQGATVEFAIARLREDGELDTSFSETGRRIVDFGSSAESRAAGVAVQLDDRIVVAGTRTNSSGSVFAVARLDEDGEFDTTFAGNGKRVIDFGVDNGNDVFASDVTLQDDGKVLVAGTLEGSSGMQLALARLDADGEPDDTLDGNGKVQTTFSPDVRGEAVAVSALGRIVVVGTRDGSSDDDFAIAVYKPDGELDEGFAGNGKRTTDFSADESAHGVAIQPDGKIVVAGTRSGSNGRDFAVARYLPDGTPDTTLDADGKRRVDLFPDESSEDEGAGVVLLPSGNILLGGSSAASGSSDLAVVRLLSTVDVATGSIEIPANGTDQSGVGLISGWVCDASDVSVVIDGAASPMRTAYGTPRADTSGVCGDSDNGFSLLFNWGLLGDGFHVIRGFADGVEFARRVFQVTTFGVSFLRDATGTFPLADFPTDGDEFTLTWTQALQRFVVTAVGPPPPAATTSDDLARPAATGLIENPVSGSVQSGVGIVSGWVCEATELLARIDGGAPQPVGYGTGRGDTETSCGDTDNGFGLLVNWGLLGDGVHEVEVFADGVSLGTTTFTVTTFGVSFLRGASGSYTLEDFPEAGAEVDVDWDQGQQGFVVTDYRP